MASETSTISSRFSIDWGFSNFATIGISPLNFLTYSFAVKISFFSLTKESAKKSTSSSTASLIKSISLSVTAFKLAVDPGIFIPFLDFKTFGTTTFVITWLFLISFTLN